MTLSVKERKRKNLERQERLEKAILCYQDALKTRDSRLIEQAYDQVCSLYPPSAHIQDWYNQYYWLFDSFEDFVQDYNRIFCQVLAAWKPREKRGKSRYDGSGEFKNYFIGALQHFCSNQVKSENAAKRNVSVMCPICNEWVNPLSSHLRQDHQDLLWDYLRNFKIDIDKITSCPFCRSHKVPRQVTCTCEEPKADGECSVCCFRAANAAIRKHLLSKHSTYLFQRFNELYPNHSTTAPKPVSAYYGEDEDGEELCYYDVVTADERISNLMSCTLSGTERLILNQILNGSSEVEYKHTLYKCTQEEFHGAMESLRTKMTIVGFN